MQTRIVRPGNGGWYVAAGLWNLLSAKISPWHLVGLLGIPSWKSASSILNPLVCTFIRLVSVVTISCVHLLKPSFLVSVLQELKLNLEQIMDQGKIAEWYRGRSVFVTGATGFMGKVLVEKLLRSCPDIQTIYVLIRSKNDSKSNSRFRDFTRHLVFDRLRREGLADRLEKISPVNGDVTHLNLGLSDNDIRTLVDEVSVVFHCAASVRFDEPLKQAVLLNVRGTREVINLAQWMTKLEAFVHVSTAFSHPTHPVIDEIVYPCDQPYNEVIDIVENFSTEELQTIENEVLKKLPNTYVYTKGLAEHVVNDQRGKLPACIFRPSVVCPSYHEPERGWVDSKNGPIGLLVGASAGVLRSMYGDGEKKIDILPVDYSINAMIAAAWHLANFKRNEVVVYNCTTSSDIHVTWNKVLDVGLREYNEAPSTKVLWYPGGGMRKNFLIHLFFLVLTQLLPALLLDAIMLLTFRKPRFLRLQKRIYIAGRALEYFVTHEWTFKNDNMRGVIKDMDAQDKKTFNFDASTFNFEDYMKYFVHGGRRFVLKHDESSIPEAKRKLRRLFWMHQALKVAICLFVVWMLSSLLYSSTSNVYLKHAGRLNF